MVILNTLGLVEYRLGHWQAAQAALVSSMKLRRGGDANDWLILALVDARLGRHDEAHAWFNKSLGWIKQNDSRRPDVRILWSEAAELLGQPGPNGWAASTGEATACCFEKRRSPAIPPERLTFAQMAYDRKYFASAAKLLGRNHRGRSEAGGRPRGPASLQRRVCRGDGRGRPGKGRTAPGSRRKGRTADQSLGWLSAAGRVAKAAASSQPRATAIVVQNLHRWKTDLDLESVRESAALAKLPPDEQKAWSALWADVDALLSASSLKPTRRGQPAKSPAQARTTSHQAARRDPPARPRITLRQETL